MCKYLKYNEVQTILVKLDCNISPAEIQGLAYGMLSMNITNKETDWLNELIDDNNLDKVATTELKHVFTQAREQLTDSNLGLELLLPNDNELLAKRLTALQEWCQGLLYGIALSGLKDFSSLPDDSREYLQDVAQIARSGDFDLEENEEAEQSFHEIVEYLRVGTLLLSEEVQPSKLETAVH